MQACRQIEPGDARDSVLKVGNSSDADIGEDEDSVSLDYRHFPGERWGCVAMINDGRVSKVFVDSP